VEEGRGTARQSGYPHWLDDSRTCQIGFVEDAWNVVKKVGPKMVLRLYSRWPFEASVPTRSVPPHDRAIGGFRTKTLASARRAVDEDGR